MGKAARNKKQPFREIKMSRREMENTLETQVRAFLPEDMRSTIMPQDMVREAMMDDHGDEDLYSLSNNILSAAVEWAEDQVVNGVVQHSAMEITSTPAIPSTSAKTIDQESAVFRYTWNSDEMMWEMVDHSALHLHEVFHNAITISHRNIPKDGHLTPAQLTISFGEVEKGQFTPSVSYGWQLHNLTTEPAAVVVPLTHGEITTEPGPVNIMEYFILEFLSTKFEASAEVKAAEDEIHHLTHQAMDALLQENRVQEGQFSLLAISMNDDEGENVVPHSGSLEWHVHNGKARIIEESPFTMGMNPFTVAAETYWGVWDYTMVALFTKGEKDGDGGSTMAWNVTPGAIEPMSAREVEEQFSEGEVPEGQGGGAPMRYLDAYPIEFHEMESEEE